MRRDAHILRRADGDSRYVQAAAIAERDRTDSEREYSPLRKPEGAHLIDTTRLSFEEQVAAICVLVDEAVERSGQRVL